MAAYIRALLDHNELHEAKMWLTRWQEQHPQESDTAEFQAEVDVADRKFDHAIEVVTKYLQKSGNAFRRTLGNRPAGAAGFQMPGFGRRQAAQGCRGAGAA